ncbi:MAG: hypothetical protein QM527_08070 [Alphaproteobacteria bacterium]|nr:hypothetical protein [Alphaproteobacteria bacterium]
MPRSRPLADAPRWLACPTTARQTEAYWQALPVWRSRGLELDLWPCTGAAEPPWALLAQTGYWRGVVLWDAPDGWGERARRQAVSVWRLALACPAAA